MIGRTLTELRARVEGLATADGEFAVRCGRTGATAPPVDGLAFPDRETAARATELAQRYRATLRRYDPRAPCYDFVVCERFDCRAMATPRDTDDGLIASCHDVGGALFEALARAGHERVERAVMDRYLATAERASRDRLCLELVTAMATAMTDLLDRRERLAVLAAAARRLAAPTESPIDSRLAITETPLAEKAVLDRADRTLTLSGYELAPAGGRLPTLPLTLALYHRHRLVPRTARLRSNAGWQLSLCDPPAGAPASAPVERRS